MNENRLVDIIKDITQSRYIGDDCAFLKDLGITVSQDSLVEDVHFRLSWMSPLELGRKTALVNISDIIASGAKPCYMSISLSLPKGVNENFVQDFYNGVMEICTGFGVQIIGGDLTGGNKVYVSATVIGKTIGRSISSRSNAQIGYKVMLYGNHGSSASGLRLLEQGLGEPACLIKAHKRPRVYSSQLPQINSSYAMMDTSDGLADALFKIAQMSDVTLKIDFDKIPYEEEIKIFDDYQDLILYGGEDYGLLATVPENVELSGFVQIGEVLFPQKSRVLISKNNQVLALNSLDDKEFKHF